MTNRDHTGLPLDVLKQLSDALAEIIPRGEDDEVQHGHILLVLTPNSAAKSTELDVVSNIHDPEVLRQYLLEAAKSIVGSEMAAKHRPRRFQ